MGFFAIFCGVFLLFFAFCLVVLFYYSVVVFTMVGDDVH